MAHPHPYHLPNIGELAGAIESSLPELAGLISPLRFLGQGYEFAAYESSSGYVFRFPKTEDAARKQMIENSLMPNLSDALPVEIPLPNLLAAPSPQCPWGFHGYRKLSGVAVAEIQDFQPLLPFLVPQMAGFLVALHGFPIDRALALCVPFDGTWLEDLRELHQFLTKNLKSRLSPLELHRLDEWWQGFLGTAEMWRFEPVLVHNDLRPDHVLVRPDTVEISGVIDFGDVVVGDPALDFRRAAAWGGEDFLLSVARAYHELGGPADSEVFDRARLLGKTSVFWDVAHAIRLGYLGPPIPTLEQAVDSLRAELQQPGIL